MKIAVFCSANDRIASEYFTMTEALGRWMGGHGHTLVYGGQNSGLMKAVADGVHAGGGMTIGVIPRILERGGQRPDDLDVEIPCETLSDRKDLILAQSDVCVALPGGVGTFDEVFTVAASHNIGYHRKMVILYNMDGFYSHLIATLDDLQRRGFIRGDWHEVIEVANDMAQLTAMLQAIAGDAEQPESQRSAAC